MVAAVKTAVIAAGKKAIATVSKEAVMGQGRVVMDAKAEVITGEKTG